MDKFGWFTGAVLHAARNGGGREAYKTEAYRDGFLSKCAEMRVSPETAERLLKSAQYINPEDDALFNPVPSAPYSPSHIPDYTPVGLSPEHEKALGDLVRGVAGIPGQAADAVGTLAGDVLELGGSAGDRIMSYLSGTSPKPMTRRQYDAVNRWAMAPASGVHGFSTDVAALPYDAYDFASTFVGGEPTGTGDFTRKGHDQFNERIGYDPSVPYSRDFEAIGYNAVPLAMTAAVGGHTVANAAKAGDLSAGAMARNAARGASETFNNVFREGFNRFGRWGVPLKWGTRAAPVSRFAQKMVRNWENVPDSWLKRHFADFGWLTPGGAAMRIGTYGLEQAAREYPIETAAAAAELARRTANGVVNAVRYDDNGNDRAAEILDAAKNEAGDLYDEYVKPRLPEYYRRAEDWWENLPQEKRDEYIETAGMAGRGAMTAYDVYRIWKIYGPKDDAPDRAGTVPEGPERYVPMN